MRDVTERPEGVEAGFLRLVGTRRNDIVSAVLEALQDGHANLPGGDNPYGDGRAAAWIVEVWSPALGANGAVRREVLGAHVGGR